MQHRYHRHERSTPNVFVDDPCMQSSGTSLDGLLDNSPAADMFGDKAELLKPTLSSKIVVTASSPKLIQAPKDELATYGIKYQIDEEINDSGSSHIAAATGPTKSGTKRVDKRVSGASRAKHLGKFE